MGKTGKIVQLITNIAIVIVCVLLIRTFLTRKTLEFGQRDSKENAEAAFRGRSMTSLPSYVWSQHPSTLMLAIREGCPYCRASYPFYKHLAELEKNGKLRAHVLIVMPDDQAIGGHELEAHGITQDAIFSVQPASINLTGTPTLLLVDPKGIASQAWIGQLTQQGEQQVISAASNLSVDGSTKTHFWHWPW